MATCHYFVTQRESIEENKQNKKIHVTGVWGTGAGSLGIRMARTLPWSETKKEQFFLKEKNNNKTVCSLPFF